MRRQYLIDLRLGYAQWRVNHISETLTRIFRIPRYRERVPHVTLFGPCSLQEGVTDAALLSAIEDEARQYPFLSLTIDGWERRQGLHGGVIAYRVMPSKDLAELRASLIARLAPLTISENAWDHDPSLTWYHVTVANRLPPHRAERIWKAMTDAKPGPIPRPRIPVLGKLVGNLRHVWRRFVHPPTEIPAGIPPPAPCMSIDVPRITVVKGDLIFAEFDLARKQWLERMDALGREGWRLTLAAYRRIAGLERVEAAAESGKVFFIGDTHFGHANIIHYSARPFSFYYPDDMDRVLIRNWNGTVGPDSLVYHLGDLRYGRGSRPAAEYLAELAGRIVLIRGNHDTDLPTDRIEVKDSLAFEHEGLHFLLVHDPLDAPAGFEGWVIHGHVHNNNLRRWPFINFVHRTINVSVEAIGYTPMSLDTICTLIRKGSESGRIGIYRTEHR